MREDGWVFAEFLAEHAEGRGLVVVEPVGIVGGKRPVDLGGERARLHRTYAHDADIVVPGRADDVARLGRFLGEVDYAYLSFIDPDVSGGQVHRVGANLRFDVDRSFRHCTHYACTRASSFYIEGGAAERFGHWFIDDAHVSPATSPTPELHIGLGLEWDNQISPHRNGWQFGLRIALTPKDVEPVAFRSGTPSSNSGGTNASVFFEWMYLLGD